VDIIFGYGPDEVQAMGRIDRLLGDNLLDRAELAARREIRNIERDVVSRSGEHRALLIHLKQVAIQSPRPTRSHVGARWCRRRSAPARRSSAGPST
jgi:hypothetical protein